MNNKGFSLVELLAVIVILAVIATVAVVSLGGIRNDVDLKIIESNFDMILATAKSYGESHLSDVVNGCAYGSDYNTCQHIKVYNLKDQELTIDDTYNDIQVYMYIKNRRVNACIHKSQSTISLYNILKTEDNINRLESYYCSEIEGDVNGDKELTIDDCSMLKSIVLKTADLSFSHVYLANAIKDSAINAQDYIKVKRIIEENGATTCPNLY